MGFDFAYAESIVERMRIVLKKRGAEGIQGLARNFRICDTNGSGQLDEEELAKCVRLPSLLKRLDQVPPRAPACRLAVSAPSEPLLMTMNLTKPVRAQTRCGPPAAG